jgi:hypothetical protein
MTALRRSANIRGPRARTRAFALQECACKNYSGGKKLPFRGAAFANEAAWARRLRRLAGSP